MHGEVLAEPTLVRGAVQETSIATVCAEIDGATRERLGAQGYWEVLPDELVRLCRVERFSEMFTSAVPLLISARALARDQYGVDPVLMKDKLNIKWPGGGGYRCHQDSRAYPATMRSVLTVGIALTPCDADRGGLHLASGVRDLLDTDERGCVSEREQQALVFSAPTLAAGDAVIFSGFVPHYSGANTSDSPRLLALFTFVSQKPDGRSANDVREEYYRWRESVIAASKGKRLSTIDDFTGVLLDS